MTIQQLRKVYEARPFVPFTLHLAGGRSVHVRSPEFMHVAPKAERTFAVYDDESYDVIDLLLVDSIEVGNGRSHSRRGRR